MYLSILLAAVVPALARAFPYAYGAGFLAAGDDLPNNPGPVTYDQAVAFCSSQLECVGFCFSSSTLPTHPISMYFKTAANFEPAPGWSTYTKAPPPEWPAVNLTVGGALRLGLRASTHTVSVMAFSDPARDDWSSWQNFSWVPSIQKRALPGCHNFGDVTIRTQPLASANASAWTYFSSAWGGGAGIPAAPLPAGGAVLVADDITALLNATPPELRGGAPFAGALPLRVTRSYEAAPGSSGADGAFVLRVNITALEDVRVGGFGFSQISDEMIGGDLDTIARVNSLVDPHIGGAHGYAEWVRMPGNQSLLVTPGAPGTGFEAWRPI